MTRQDFCDKFNKICNSYLHEISSENNASDLEIKLNLALNEYYLSNPPKYEEIVKVTINPINRQLEVHFEQKGE